MKEFTFYRRFENDILARRKTITLREAADAQVAVGEKLRVSRYEDGQFFCHIEVLSVSAVQYDNLNEYHAVQENMSLGELKQLIGEIYPGLNSLIMIEFRLV